MLGGCADGAAGGAFPSAEMLILASLVGLALALLADARPPLALSAAVIALFAIGHGFAHGSEMGAGASAYPFAGGFLIATALLHGLGLLVSRWATGAAQRRVRSEEHTSELQSLMRISYAVFCLNNKTKNKQRI